MRAKETDYKEVISDGNPFEEGRDTSLDNEFSKVDMEVFSRVRQYLFDVAENNTLDNYPVFLNRFFANADVEEETKELLENHGEAFCEYVLSNQSILTDHVKEKVLDLSQIIRDKVDFVKSEDGTLKKPLVQEVFPN